MSNHATPEELQQAHNEGQTFVKEDEELGFVGSIVHEFLGGPHTTFWDSEEKCQEIHEAFEKGKENARSQR